MDYKEKILLGNQKNINSLNVDNDLKIFLKNEKLPITEYNIKRFLDLSDVFEKERRGTHIYRIYGTVDYLSLLNKLPQNYENIWDFFRKKPFFDSIEEIKTLNNSFDIYLIKQSINYINIYDNQYYNQYKVIATSDNINIMNAGYSVNLFGENKYYFDFNLDFDLDEEEEINTEQTTIKHPTTNLFLYFEYKPSENETLKYKNPLNESYINFTKPEGGWDMGDLIFDHAIELPIGDMVEYNIKDFNIETISKQKFKIITPTKQGDLVWEYEPMLPIRLRYLSSEISRGSKSSTSYEQQNTIPLYATQITNNGDYIWREILDDGIFDSITDNGVDHPFINKRKYVFNNSILSIIPDLTHTNTKNIFNEIEFGEPQTITNQPINDDINNIGKSCQ